MSPSLQIRRLNELAEKSPEWVKTLKFDQGGTAKLEVNEKFDKKQKISYKDMDTKILHQGGTAKLEVNWNARRKQKITNKDMDTNFNH